MKRTSIVLRTAGVLTAAAMLTSDAWARDGQSPRFDTTVTVPGHAKWSGAYLVSFNTPVGLPGLSLDSGTYMFRFVGTGRNALQVLNAEGTVSYGLFLPIAIQRSGPLNDAAVWLMPPASSGGPRRIQAVFEPGASTGSEFVYR